MRGRVRGVRCRRPRPCVAPAPLAAARYLLPRDSAGSRDCRAKAKPGRAGPPPAPLQSLRPPRSPGSPGPVGAPGLGAGGTTGPGKGRGSGQKGGIAGGTREEMRAEG